MPCKHHTSHITALQCIPWIPAHMLHCLTMTQSIATWVYVSELRFLNAS